MSTQQLCLLALEEAAAAEGRAYGRERLRERLQQIAEQQGSICPRSSLRLKDACFRELPLETTLGRLTIRAHYGYNSQSQRWMFPVKELWGLAAHQEVSPYLEHRMRLLPKGPADGRQLGSEYLGHQHSQARAALGG